MNTGHSGSRAESWDRCSPPRGTDAALLSAKKEQAVKPMCIGAATRRALLRVRLFLLFVYIIIYHYIVSISQNVCFEN